MANLSLSLGGNIVVALLLVALLIGAAFLFYRYTLPPLPLNRRMVLSALRALSLVLMLLIFFEPILRLMQTDRQQAQIAVLIDNSQSMTIPSPRNRASGIRRLIGGGGGGLKGLPSGAGVRLHLFSSKLGPAVGSLPDSLAFDGQSTDISEALSGLKDQIAGENIRGVVLVSDGNYIAGRNPLYEAEALRVPVFTVGVGDTNEQKDILIEKVVSNSIAYAETRVPVDVTIKASGFPAQNVEVTLSEESSVLDRTVLSLREGSREYPLKMTVVPKEEGTKKYTVSVSPLSGELTEKNNSRSFFVKVLRSKLKVALFAGAPGPDVPAVRQALLEDGHFGVSSFVQKSANEFYEGAFSRQALDSADCIVLIGFPTQSTPAGVIQQVADVIEREHKPLFFVNGRTVDYSRLQRLEPYLPFAWSGVNQTEILVQPSIPPGRAGHPLVALQSTATEETWRQLPPVFKTLTAFRTKPEAEALAMAVYQNIPTTEPLIAARNTGSQKSYAITGEGIWRWRVLAQDDTRTAALFTNLMGNVIRWLTTREDQKRVRVTPVKDVFTTAEAAEMTGQVYDEQLRPEDDAELTVEVERGKDKTRFQLTATGNGRYDGSVDGLPEGDYTYAARATAGGALIGEDRGKFSVGQANVEFLQTRMNKQLLEQVAYQTGGKYYDIDQAEGMSHDIAEAVKLEPKEIVNTSEIELWNWKYLALAIILLLAIEWFMRKRSGMI
jgi:hypothetical protein